MHITQRTTFGKGGWKVPSGKGQRLIVVHTCTVEGWVKGAELVRQTWLTTTMKGTINIHGVADTTITTERTIEPYYHT